MYVERMVNVMNTKWNRKSNSLMFAPYVREDGKVKVVDMSLYDPKWFKENGRRGYWWATISVQSDGTETLEGWNFKTAKEAKAFGATIYIND